MGKKFYTIMIVPHAAAKFRRLKVSRNFLLMAGSFLGVLTIGGLMLPHFLLKSSQLNATLEKLTRENAELKKANEKFDASLADLRSKLSDFETKAAKFALMVGVEDPNAQQMGAGGSTFDLKSLSPRASRTVLEGEINTLRERSGALQDSFRTLDMAFQKQSLLLSSTPSIFPVRGLMGNGFGWRRDPFTGMRDFHQGLDIVAPLGTKVMAPADGIVTRVGPAGGFGNSIVISHGYGIITRYGHLSAIGVRVGQRVKRGDIIGNVGTTGRSTGPHLHYEVLVHQHNVDPVKYILEEFRSF
ncbi:MAG TPA: peptidoglycan DD-metalloendopeptidase family protein [Candidatus Polarisedimenticolia bacterium]|nr:peptidoglycan DD-metalloendopeptidase family protein [Candidatus Polarisedimenticolia bacterium]